jgi:hypothetical protein
MVEVGDEHRRHPEEAVRALGLDELEHEPRVEVRRQHERPLARNRPEHGHRAAGGVEQRHRAELHEAGAEPEPVAVRQPCVVDDPAVVQHRALGPAGRSRRVLDLSRIAGIDPRQPGARRADGAEVVPVGERDDIAQAGQLAAQGVEHLRHGRAAVLGHEEDPVRARLAQHVPELVFAQRRVERDDRHARHRRGKLEDHPLRDVVRPDRNALAAGEAPEQGPRGLLGLLEQRAVRPPPPRLGVGRALHQRDRVGVLRGGLAQQVADGEVEDRPRAIRGPLSGREGAHGSTLRSPGGAHNRRQAAGRTASLSAPASARYTDAYRDAIRSGVKRWA